MLRKAPDDQRSKMISEAIAKDDRMFLGAVMCGPSSLIGMLVGLAPEHLDMFQEQYERTHHADSRSEIAAFEAATEMLDRAAVAATAQARKLVDSDELARATAAASAADAAVMKAALDPDAAE